MAPPHPHAARSGSALLLSVVAIVVLTMLAGSVLSMANSLGRREGRVADQKQAFYLAEAGLAEAYVGLAVAKTGNIGTEAAPALMGGGLVWVEATEHPNGHVELRSTGLSGSGRAVLGLVVEPTTVDLSTLQPIFSGSSLSVPAGSFIDSYDSTAGDYASQVAAGATTDSGAVLLGSPDSVSLIPGGSGKSGGKAGVSVVAGGSGESTVFGGVLYGATGTFDDPAGAVKGKVASTPAPPELPPIPFPVEKSLAGSLRHDDPVPLVLPAGEHSLERLTVATGSEVIVLGPTILAAGSVELEPGSALTFDTLGGPVQCLVRDHLVVDSGASVVNTTEDPSALSIVVSGADRPGGPAADVRGSGPFHGAMLVPSGTLSITASFEVFGSLRANALSADSALHLHVDRHLSTVEGQQNLPELQAWRVVDIPKGLAANGSNPFLLLGIDPAGLESLSEAHQDQQLSIAYVDLAGLQQTYDGWESGFDWQNVSVVHSASRDGESLPGVIQTAPSLSGGAAASDSMIAAPPDTISPVAEGLADPTLTSYDKTNLLLDNLPLSANDLNTAIALDPPLVSADLKSVLFAASGTDGGAGGSAEVLTTAVQQGPLTSFDLKEVLVQNSPLPDSVLSAVLDRVPPLDSPDLNDVLAAQ